MYGLYGPDLEGSYEVPQLPRLGEEVIVLPGGKVVHPIMNDPIGGRVEVSPERLGDQHKPRIQEFEKSRRGQGARIH